MKIQGLIIGLIFSISGFSQNIKSDVQLVFFNQPVFDSINEITKGDFGIKFNMDRWILPLPGPPTIKFHYSFKGHYLSKKAFGLFQIEKLYADTSVYFVWIQMNFNSSKEQILTFNKILALISKYPNVNTTIDDSELNDEVIGQEAKMIFSLDNKVRTLTLRYINYKKHFKTEDKYYLLDIILK